MYWTDWEEDPKDSRRGRLERAWMDGSHRDIFVTSKTVLWPNGLSLDIPAGRLYWVDAFYDRIETILLNGTDRKVGRHVCIANPCSCAGNSMRMWMSVCPGLCAAYMFTHGSVSVYTCVFVYRVCCLSENVCLPLTAHIHCVCTSVLTHTYTTHCGVAMHRSVSS